MIDADDLLSLVRIYNPKTDADMLRGAHAYAERMHEGQFRHSGEPYLSHPVAVAAILTEQRLDDATIATALLHDTIEDSKGTYAEIAHLFGADVAELVNGVTKLTNLELSSRESKQAENFRKLLMAMSKDLRVILVKLADRLHNMRTIRHMPLQKQQRKAQETMDIYAPLAGRMGMQWMRDELEDLAFTVLSPDERSSIIRRFLTLQKETGEVIPRITDDIEAVLDRHGIKADVFGRAKRPFSIWRKMKEKNLAFSRLSDIYGFRVLTETENDCYRAIGAVHQRWRAVPGRFKDYISQPKSNGYRSIHTTVSGRDGKTVEVQIRTRQMHEVAESGVAAHWSYRDGVRAENPFAVDPAEWLDSLTERFQSSDDHDEFLEHVKLDLYSDQVFCFTPKGDVVKLPKGATPIDFAYAIHTRIGHSCVGAKVDGIRVPLWTRLKNGRSVTILTAEGQTPQISWMDIAATGRAKAAIRRSLREEDRVRYIALGRELARVAFEQAGKRATDKALRTAAKAMNLKSADEVLARIGSAELSARRVVAALYPELVDRTEAAEIEEHRAVVGLPSGTETRRAQCCQAVPGERIVGIAYPGKGPVVHAIDCPALADFETRDDDRWIDVRWSEGRHAPVHNVTIEMTLSNESGVLGRICTLIGEQKANISDLHFVDRKPDFFRILIDVDVRNAKHLHAVMMAVEADSDVAALSRFRDLDRSP